MAEPTDAGCHPERLPVDHRAEVLARHRDAVAAGEPGYADPETGLFVFTAAYHRARYLLRDRVPSLPVPLMMRRQPQTYVAFVRAVMHGRRGLHRSVLLDLFADAGATDPRSYLTTGNVSFSVHPSAVARLVVDVEAALEQVVDRRTEVFVRSVRELVALRELDAFAATPLSGAHERVVSFLPGPVPALDLPLWSPGRDVVVFAAGGRELFSAAVRKDDGTSRGAGGLIERVTRTRVTSRAWSTVERILAALT